GADGVLRRHNEVRGALRFFLDSWYKNKTSGTIADKNQVMFDYLKYKGVTEIAQHLHAPAPQVFRK
uniref:mS113 n=1 Tax=Polytomella magna TaxID=353565 RepID=UPI002240E3FC|nr:Chain Yh, mS113 [Polytomella magna]8APN_Yh Chain Yh, mS113 [Polytomella magna]8APO_Yh Chain Yh, mS113 [Polytomella magna]